MKNKETLEKYCAEQTDPRYKQTWEWILSRANHYAEKTGMTQEQVINAWEEDRSYSVLNYYQDSNQPEINSETIIKYEDWFNELRKRFGDNAKQWKFKCPKCGNIQCAQDFIDAQVSHPQDKVYYSCIGRYVKGKGCDWTLGGLLQIHKVSVLHGVKVIPVFEMADMEVV